MITEMKTRPGWDMSVILTNDHKRHGLTLLECDHTVSLLKNGTEVAHFGPNSTITAIYKEADSWLPDRDAIQCLVDRGGIVIEPVSPSGY